MSEIGTAAPTDASYQRIEGVLRWLNDHYVEQPTLNEAASVAGLSEFHFQRLFCRWVGLTPKKYVQYLTLNHAKESLRRSKSVLDAAFDAGLSGPSRLHDLFVTFEAMTPGEYKSGGRDLEIYYGFDQSPYGEFLIGWCHRGVSTLMFTDGERETALLEAKRSMPEARWIARDRCDVVDTKSLFEAGQGQKRIKLLVAGTAFEIKVWEALLSIPFGHLTTYAGVAKRIGKPNAARAVGRAIGANKIAYIIPCHRVIRGSGVITGYRWGSHRKLALLTREHLINGTNH